MIGKAQYSWPPCTDSLEQELFILITLFTFSKLASLMRRSTVPSLPLQLVFPGVTENSGIQHDGSQHNVMLIVAFITESLFF